MEITEEMMIAALKEAAQQKLIPKYGNFDDIAEHRARIRAVLEAALEYADLPTERKGGHSYF